MVSNYYELGKLGYVSNSMLSEINRSLTNGYKAKAETLQFGLLTDALITQPDTANVDLAYIEDESRQGKIISFEEEEILKAQLMRDAYNSDPDLQILFSDAVTQYIYLREKFAIEHAGETMYTRACCKFDLLIKNVIGGDIKTTTAKTQTQFEAAIKIFGYHRQAAWYMDIAKLNRFILIGLGKNKVNGKHPVFKYAIRRNSPIYLLGKKQYQELFFLHQLNN